MSEPSNVVVTDVDEPDAPWFFEETTPFLEKMQAEFPLRDLHDFAEIKSAISTRLRWMREHPEGSVISRWHLLELGYLNRTHELVQEAIVRLRAERSGASLQEISLQEGGAKGDA